MTERIPSTGELLNDLMARLREAEDVARAAEIRSARLETQLRMTQEQLDMTRERLHEALTATAKHRNGEPR